MQNSLSFLLILISAVFQVKGWADDNLFTDDLHDPNAFFSDSSSDSFTLIDVAGGLNQDENAAFDTLPSLPVDDNASLDTLASLPVDEDSSFDTPTPLPEDEDNSFDGLALPPADEDLLFDTLALYEWHEVEPEPVVVDCPATDGLGKRDDTMFCPTDDFKAPDLPTLDGITDKLNPPNEKDDALRQISPLNYQAPPGDYSKCPPNRPFQLCCNCNGNFEFEFCNDCLQCKPLLHFSKKSYGGQSP